MHKCRSCTQFYLDLPHHVVGICPGLPQDASLETQHLKEIWHIAWARKLICAHYRSIYRRKPPGTCCRIRFAWKTKKQTSKPNPRTNKSSKPTNQPTPQPNKSLWHITGFLCPRQDRKVNMTALITSYWRLENVVLHPSNHSPPDRNNLGQKGSQEVIWSILYQSEADFKEACLMSQLGINCHKRVSFWIKEQWHILSCNAHLLAVPSNVDFSDFRFPLLRIFYCFFSLSRTWRLSLGLHAKYTLNFETHSKTSRRQLWPTEHLVSSASAAASWSSFAMTDLAVSPPRRSISLTR